MVDHQRRVHARHRQVAAADAAHGAQQRLPAQVLGQVAERAVTHRVQQVSAIGRDGEHHDARLGQARRQLADRLDARHPGQVDVEQHEIGPEPGRHLERLLGAPGLPNHGHVGCLERLADRGSDERVVVDQQHSHRRLSLHASPPVARSA